MARVHRHLLDMEVSMIWMHFSFHFLGLPGICERGIPFSVRLSSMQWSALERERRRHRRRSSVATRFSSR